MDLYTLPNFRAIKIKFVSCTNHRGARVKLTDDYVTEKKQSVYLSYDYAVGDVFQQAINYLIERGFKVAGRATTEKEYIALVDHWGDDYKTLK
ncbi:hypothetical protein [Endozoicomonas ascidiicola]|uniref:hypothetical protein n=1 Tax=Endozoicomonas ascidiicola TaxID=1698521 RepID=UPI0008313A21|nr:hypothetical protein [Endozoicomonas ascidiicola]